MSFQVKFLSFTKRENSTSTPSAAQINAAYGANCVLIDDTSIMNPTFKIENPYNAILTYNYCYVQMFNRYYFITDIRNYRNFWYISCTCDVLATYKTAIGNSSHYVLRAASEYDLTISDSAYPAKTAINTYIDYVDGGTDPLKWSNGHCYIVGIVGQGRALTEQYGSLVYYIFKPAAMGKFLEYLMTNIDSWSNLTGQYTTGVQQALINPIQYIKSCICMPFNKDDIVGSDVASVKFGYYEWTVPSGDLYTVETVTDTNIVKTKDISYIDIRKHPQAATRGSYLNCQPFSKYTLHYGPWGDIDLDPMLLNGNNKIILETLYDLVSGVGRLIVKGNVATERILYNGTVKIGVDVNLSQVYKDALGYESTFTHSLFSSISAGINVGMGNLADIPKGLDIATSGVQNMTRLNYPTVSGVGDSGCYLPFHDTQNLYLLSKFNNIVDENLTEIGRPLCATRQINTLSGYILCSGADCQITGTQEEAIKVNQYMNTGFFYE